MEWILCLFPKIEPHEFLLDMQLEKPKFNLKDIDRTNPLVFEFLTPYINDRSFSHFIKCLHEVYLPPSASNFVKALLKFDRTIYEHYKKSEKDKNPRLRFNMQYIESEWKSDPKNKTLLNPTNMLMYLNSLKRNHDSAILNSLMFSNEHIPYLDRFLMKHYNDNRVICEILKNNIAQANLFLLLKFLKQWEPKSTNAQECKLSFIRSQSSYIIQILFASENCWYDSSIDACEGCSSFNWIDFLSQWRCVALCDGNKRQCFRFAIPQNQFCKFHQIRPVKKYLKRQFEKQLKYTNTKSEEYEANPNDDDNINQPMRYHLTNRPINPMNKLHKKFNVLPDGYYIPIIRYEGVYYSQDDTKSSEQFCGKFFYYEPESNIYLKLGKTCLFATKVDAFMQLSFLLNLSMRTSKLNIIHSYFSSHNKYRTDILDSILSMDFITQNTESCTRDLLDEKFWDDFLTYRFRTVFLSIEHFNNFLHEKCIPLFYPTEKIKELEGDGVADFDFLDQDICKIARKLGFDTVILQHEIGSHDAVTEIIHTGNYKEDLYEINDIKMKFKPQTIYPKIWFPKENGLVFIQNQKKKYMPILNFRIFQNNDFEQHFTHDNFQSKHIIKHSLNLKKLENPYDYESESESENIDNFG